jgi:hypothetical protein
LFLLLLNYWLFGLSFLDLFFNLRNRLLNFSRSFVLGLSLGLFRSLRLLFLLLLLNYRFVDAVAEGVAHLVSVDDSLNSRTGDAVAFTIAFYFYTLSLRMGGHFHGPGLHSHHAISEEAEEKLVSNQAVASAVTVNTVVSHVRRLCRDK